MWARKYQKVSQSDYEENDPFAQTYELDDSLPLLNNIQETSNLIPDSGDLSTIPVIKAQNLEFQVVSLLPTPAEVEVEAPFEPRSPIVEQGQIQEREPEQNNKPVIPASYIVESHDGVFFNLAAKPGVNNNLTLEIPTENTQPIQDYEFTTNRQDLPDYDQALSEPAPPHFNLSNFFQQHIMTPRSDPIINGLPVGSLISFIIVMLISSFFQFIGFTIAYIIHTSHATKYGTLAGLGITLLQLGYYIFFKIQDIQLGTTGGPRDYVIDPSYGNLSLPILIFSYMFMVIGWCLFLNFTYEFVMVAKLRYRLTSAPPSHVAAQV